MLTSAARDDPDVYRIVRFHDIDTSPDRQCIYITLEGTRCCWGAREVDDSRVRELYDEITASTALPSLETLQEFAKCNCCGAKPHGARHRDRIEDIGTRTLLLPLARRWREEIRTKRAECTISNNISTHTIKPAPIPRSVPSRFRPQIDEPDENVASKLLSPLSTSNEKGNRDFESGIIYIFSRDEDPGFVKIGWTANTTAARRLEDWSESCGYKPRLVWSSPRVPFAQRVETLIHYELSTEWRVERVCQGCRRSHQEWFEVDQARAISVVKDWEALMTMTDHMIYDSESGRLADDWARVAKSLSSIGMAVTAKTLMEHRMTLSRITRSAAPIPQAAEIPPRSLFRDTTFTFTTHSPKGTFGKVFTPEASLPLRYSFLSSFTPISEEEKPSVRPPASNREIAVEPSSLANAMETKEPSSPRTTTVRSGQDTKTTSAAQAPLVTTTATIKSANDDELPSRGPAPRTPRVPSVTPAPVVGPFGKQMGNNGSSSGTTFDAQMFSNPFAVPGKMIDQQWFAALTTPSSSSAASQKTKGADGSDARRGQQIVNTPPRSAGALPHASTSKSPSTQTHVVKKQAPLRVNDPALFKFSGSGRAQKVENKVLECPVPMVNESSNVSLISELNALALSD